MSRRHVAASLRRVVSERAEGRCEYCLLSQEGQEASFHIDHVVPLRAGGETAGGNLALACVSCSLRKAARETAIDPGSGLEVPLFNSRRADWQEHFRWEGLRVVGRTASGRATVDALRMNRPMILAIRFEEAVLGRLPDE